jgi:hypothetical protein
MIKDNDRVLHLIDEICSNLTAVDSEEIIEELSEQIFTIFKRSDMKEIDFFVLRDVAHVICGKLAFSNIAKLQPNMVRLYEFFRQNKYVSGIFEKYIEEKYDLGRESAFIQKKHQKPIKMIAADPSNCAKQVTVHLKQLLNINPKSNVIDKNLGFCLLDLEGNFLLLCKKSRHLFGIKNTETKICNFFELMIPYSKQILSKKFGNEMFHEDRLVKSTRNFNYVIYSKTALKKFYNILKGKKIDSKEGLDLKLETLETTTQGNDLYNAYLTALTSCATIITIKYTASEVVELSDQKLLFRKNFKLFENDFATKQFTTQAKYENSTDPSSTERNNLDNFREQAGNYQSITDGMDISNRPAGDSLQTVFTKHVILLKTRYSKNVPKFSYQNLKDQMMIVNFKNYLRAKIFGADDKNQNVDQTSNAENK